MSQSAAAAAEQLHLGQHLDQVVDEVIALAHRLVDEALAQGGTREVVRLRLAHVVAALSGVGGALLEDATADTCSVVWSSVVEDLTGGLVDQLRGGREQP